MEYKIGDTVQVPKGQPKFVGCSIVISAITEGSVRGSFSVGNQAIDVEIPLKSLKKSQKRSPSSEVRNPDEWFRAAWINLTYARAMNENYPNLRKSSRPPYFSSVASGKKGAWVRIVIETNNMEEDDGFAAVGHLDEILASDCISVRDIAYESGKGAPHEFKKYTFKALFRYYANDQEEAWRSDSFEIDRPLKEHRNEILQKLI